MPGSPHDAVAGLLETMGPLTGLEITREIDADSLLVWKACATSPALRLRAFGRRYLRLDRSVEGYARLSPSILREFFTYSVVGLAGDEGRLDARCAELAARIRGISGAKLALARQTSDEVVAELGGGLPPEHRLCFIIAGDIVYDMAHDVPRPERSTGKLVRGSDIDIVVVVDDAMPDAAMRALDERIYQKKYRLLITPAVREEIDYKVKRLEVVRGQARFDDFKKMVAMKILHEGVLLYGSEELFGVIKGIVREEGVVEKLGDLERRAIAARREAEAAILGGSLDKETIRRQHLFYSADEFEEFE